MILRTVIAAAGILLTSAVANAQGAKEGWYFGVSGGVTVFRI